MLLTLAVGLPAAVLSGGCLSRPSLVPQSFTFSTPASRSSGPLAGGRVLALRSLSVAPPFAGQSFVYRTGEFAYERDPYAQFLVPPQDSLAEPVRAYLRNARIFSAVVEPGSALRPNTLVEISVPELYGDFRNRAAPAAVLAVRFVFLDAPNALPGRILSQETYSGRIPLKTRTAAAVMAGWNDALKTIMAEATSGLPTNEL